MIFKSLGVFLIGPACCCKAPSELLQRWLEAVWVWVFGFYAQFRSFGTVNRTVDPVLAARSVRNLWEVLTDFHEK